MSAIQSAFYFCLVMRSDENKPKINQEFLAFRPNLYKYFTYGKFNWRKMRPCKIVFSGIICLTFSLFTCSDDSSVSSQSSGSSNTDEHKASADSIINKDSVLHRNVTIYRIQKSDRDTVEWNDRIAMIKIQVSASA